MSEVIFTITGSELVVQIELLENKQLLVSLLAAFLGRCSFGLISLLPFYFDRQRSRRFLGLLLFLLEKVLNLTSKTKRQATADDHTSTSRLNSLLDPLALRFELISPNAVLQTTKYTLFRLSGPRAQQLACQTPVLMSEHAIKPSRRPSANYAPASRMKLDL